MTYSLDFGWLAGATGAIARGAATTILLIAVTTLAGTLLSILGAAGRRNGPLLLKRAIGWYVEVIRNTPFLVQLFFIFFGLPSIGVRLDPVLAAKFWLRRKKNPKTKKKILAGRAPGAPRHNAA
ncbi:ABC transporter permease subunit, partial [Mesorhizobium sp. M0048]|uniref:ABC transporter permease subunit n=1 Tax=Mesorhizobium sp. M0048 TaxID=2956860 RepID=UPI00333DA1A2